MLATAFIIDNKGKRISAIIPIKQYEQLVKKLEDLDDIKAYDKAIRKKQNFVPLEKALKKLEKSRKENK